MKPEGPPPGGKLLAQKKRTAHRSSRKARTAHRSSRKAPRSSRKAASKTKGGSFVRLIEGGTFVNKPVRKLLAHKKRAARKAHTHKKLKLRVLTEKSRKSFARLLRHFGLPKDKTFLKKLAGFGKKPESKKVHSLHTTKTVHRARKLRTHKKTGKKLHGAGKKTYWMKW
jgi:hypothetical protein